MTMVRNVYWRLSSKVPPTDSPGRGDIEAVIVYLPLSKDVWFTWKVNVKVEPLPKSPVALPKTKLEGPVARTVRLTFSKKSPKSETVTFTVETLTIVRIRKLGPTATLVTATSCTG